MELKARNKDIRIVQDFESGDAARCSPTSARCARSRSTSVQRRQVHRDRRRDPRARRLDGRRRPIYVASSDNGPGIPADEIPVVLSAFGQGSIAIKSAEQGTGLGLPIVQGLLAMHGGEFELHSKLREGTEAIAIFPPSRVMEELPPLPTRHGASRGALQALAPHARAAAMPELDSAAALTSRRQGRAHRPRHGCSRDRAAA